MAFLFLKEVCLKIFGKKSPKHKKIPRNMRLPFAGLVVALCMIIAPIASANMNVIDVSGWQSADVTRVVDADARGEGH